jgi:hypothetical protein
MPFSERPALTQWVIMYVRTLSVCRSILPCHKSMSAGEGKKTKLPTVPGGSLPSDAAGQAPLPYSASTYTEHTFLNNADSHHEAMGSPTLCKRGEMD